MFEIVTTTGRRAFLYTETGSRELAWSLEMEYVEMLSAARRVGMLFIGISPWTLLVEAFP